WAGSRGVVMSNQAARLSPPSSTAPIGPSRARRTVMWPVYVLVAAMVSELFLGDRNIGGYSPRVYLYGLLLFLAIGNPAGRVRELRRRPKTFRYLVVTYVVFVVWVVAAKLATGDSLGSIASTVITKHAVALV